MVHIYELDNYLILFPKLGSSTSKKLSDNKMKEITEYGILVSWQNQMSIQ